MKVGENMKKIVDVVLEREYGISKEILSTFQEKMSDWVGTDFDEDKLQEEMSRFLRKRVNHSCAAVMGPWKFRTDQKGSTYQGEFLCFAFGSTALAKFEFILE